LRTYGAAWLELCQCAAEILEALVNYRQPGFNLLRVVYTLAPACSPHVDKLSKNCPTGIRQVSEVLFAMVVEDIGADERFCQVAPCRRS